MNTADRLILENAARFQGATVVMVIDRNELEGQLTGWVEALMGDLQGSGIAVEIAKRKSHLQSLLKQQFSGLVVTMIHNFDKADANLSPSDHVFVQLGRASCRDQTCRYL